LTAAGLSVMVTIRRPVHFCRVMVIFGAQQ